MSEERYGIYYLKWHRPEESHYYKHMVFIKTIQDYLPNKKDAYILDIGCGIGCNLFCLKLLGYNNVKGIEIEGEFVNIAKNNGFDVELVDDTISWLKKHRCQYDLIFLLDVLEHIEKTRQIDLLKAIRESLKEGGKLILTVPNANSIFACRWRYNDFTHHICYTEHSIEFILKNAGFSKLEIKDTQPKNLYYPLRKILRAVYRIFLISEFGLKEGLKIPLSLNLLVIAWK